MLEMAQEMFKAIQDRFRTTLRVVADLAESVGVPSTVTTLLTRKCGGAEESWPDPPRRTDMDVDRSFEPVVQDFAAPHPAAEPGQQPGNAEDVRPLRIDDAISGSTYLARIIWTLGVSELEGTGPLRPADMARMIMSRSPVSLEPPNVARYIRRSKPSCIEVARTEGSSSFYTLNAEGRALFGQLFRDKK